MTLATARGGAHRRPMRVGRWLAATLLVGACGGGSTSVHSVGPTGQIRTRILVLNPGRADQVLRLEATGLPPPSAFAPCLRVYVAWSEAPGLEPARVGVLSHDPARRRGTLKVATVLPDFTLLVTAETAPAPSAPGIEVLRRRVRVGGRRAAAPGR